jgi:hypothetical protein
MLVGIKVRKALIEGLPLYVLKYGLGPTKLLRFPIWWIAIFFSLLKDAKIDLESKWNVLQIYMAKEMVWENVIVLFHNETDFFEDWNDLAWHLIKMKESPQKVIAGLSKKVFSSSSTKHTPCAEYPVQKCLDMSLKKELFALQNCQVPFMFTG